MILTISIISGVMFFVYFCSISIGKEDGTTNILTYGAILSISTWCQNTVLGIVFLSIVILMTIIAILGYSYKR